MPQVASETKTQAMHQPRPNLTGASRASAQAPATPFESLLDNSAPADALTDAPAQAKIAPADTSQKPQAAAKDKTAKADKADKTEEIGKTGKTDKTEKTDKTVKTAKRENPAKSAAGALLSESGLTGKDVVQTDAAKPAENATEKAGVAVIASEKPLEQAVSGDAVKVTKENKAGKTDKPDGGDPADTEAPQATPAAAAAAVAAVGAIVAPAVVTPVRAAAAAAAPGVDDGQASAPVAVTVASAPGVGGGDGAVAAIAAVVGPVTAAVPQALTGKPSSDAVAADGSKDVSKNGAPPTRLAALKAGTDQAADAGQAANPPLAPASKDGAPDADKKSAAPDAGEHTAAAPAAAVALHAGAPKSGGDGGQPLTLTVPAQQATPTFSGVPTNAGAPAPPPPAAAAVPLAGVAIEIAGRALAGKNRFDIRLDPPELGRIEVRLDVARDGRVTTHVVADRADTLALLQGDASGLQRSLQDAGLKTADNGLQFSLRDHSAGQQQQQMNGSDGARSMTDDAQAPVIDETPAMPTRYVTHVGGIDIRV